MRFDFRRRRHWHPGASMHERLSMISIFDFHGDAYSVPLSTPSAQHHSVNIGNNNNNNNNSWPFFETLNLPDHLTCAIAKTANQDISWLHGLRLCYVDFVDTSSAKGKAASSCSLSESNSMIMTLKQFDDRHNEFNNYIEGQMRQHPS